MRRCCVWDKPSSPLSTPPWLWGESEAAQDCTGDGGEEGLQKPKPVQLSEATSGRMVLEIQMGMLSPNKLPPSQHWEFLGCQRETHKYLSLSEACLCLTGALSGDSKAQGKIKCSFHQAGLANYLGKKIFLEFSCFLEKKRK